MSFDDEWLGFGYGWHLRLDGHLRIMSGDAHPRSNGKGWMYSYPNNRFFAAGEVRSAVVDALAGVEPGDIEKSEYWLSVPAALVLYPDVIKSQHILTMDPVVLETDYVWYRMNAPLPFGSLDTPVVVSTVIDTSQKELVRVVPRRRFRVVSRRSKA